MIIDRLLMAIVVTCAIAIGYLIWQDSAGMIKKKYALCAELATPEAIQYREELMDSIINQIWSVKELLIILDEHIKDPTTTPEQLLEYTRSWHEGIELSNLGQDTLDKLRKEHKFIQDNCIQEEHNDNE